MAIAHPESMRTPVSRRDVKEREGVEDTPGSYAGMGAGGAQNFPGAKSLKQE